MTVTTMINTSLLVLMCLTSARSEGTDSCTLLAESGGEAQLGLIQKKHATEKRIDLDGASPKQGPKPASGAAASLDEEGYQIVASQCCHHEMAEYIRRVVHNDGFQVCNEGGLQGTVPFYTCQKGPRTYAALVADILRNSASKCPWVGRAGVDCPMMNEDCPQFPFTEPEDCGCTRGDSFNINFFESVVTHSNLGGVGPDSGAEELRYTNIGTVNGAVVDLKVTAAGDYQKAGTNNGKNEKYGRINVLGGHSGDMTFTIVASGTDNEVEIGEIHFTILDIDTSTLGRMQEKVYISGFHSFSIDLDTEFQIERADDGRTLFSASHHGHGCDNPTDPEQLGQVTCPDPSNPGNTHVVDQSKRAVMVVYQNVASWTVTFSATCDLNIGGSEDCSSGRNFFFAGTSSLESRCQA